MSSTKQTVRGLLFHVDSKSDREDWNKDFYMSFIFHLMRHGDLIFGLASKYGLEEENRHGPVNNFDCHRDRIIDRKFSPEANFLPSINFQSSQRDEDVARSEARSRLISNSSRASFAECSQAHVGHEVLPVEVPMNNPDWENPHATRSFSKTNFTLDESFLSVAMGKRADEHEKESQGWIFSALLTSFGFSNVRKGEGVSSILCIK